VLSEYDANWRQPAVRWKHPFVKAVLAEKNQLEAERLQLQNSTYQTMLPERLVRSTHTPFNSLPAYTTDMPHQLTVDTAACAVCAGNGVQRITNQRIAQQETKAAKLEVHLGLRPGQEIPASWNVPNQPLPDPSDPFADDPFANPPLRKLADIAADYYIDKQPNPPPAAATAEPIASAVDGQSVERKEAEDRYIRSAMEWCTDCDVLKLQLQETVTRVSCGRPWKGLCYSCACRRLGVPERGAEEELADDQSACDGDSVADGKRG